MADPLQKISVVVPAYNREHLIAPTLESILAQTYPVHEVIVVDDGSRDGTADAASRFGPRVRVIRQSNTGVPGARNRGISEANGDWIALCDSDDIWEPQKLEIQMRALALRPEARWCFGDALIVDQDGLPRTDTSSGFESIFPVFNTLSIDPYSHFAKYLSEFEVKLNHESVRAFFGDLYEMLFLGNVILPSSALIRPDVFTQVGLFDTTFRVAEDTEFFHRVASRCPGIVLCTPLVSYRVGHASLVSSNSVVLVENALRSLDLAILLRDQEPATRIAYEEGKRLLLRRLAYFHLTDLDRTRARARIRELWATGAPRDISSVVIFLASLSPGFLLSLAGRIKSALRRSGA